MSYIPSAGVKGVHAHSSTHFIQSSKLEEILYYDFLILCL